MIRHTCITYIPKSKTGSKRTTIHTIRSRCDLYAYDRCGKVDTRTEMGYRYYHHMMNEMHDSVA
jgi:hypothetical protein